MNITALKGHWHDLKDKIHERWGKLSTADIEQIQGRCDQLLGKVQRAYGLSKEEAERQIQAFEDSCQDDAQGMAGHAAAMRATAGAGLSPDETETEARVSEFQNQHH